MGEPKIFYFFGWLANLDVVGEDGPGVEGRETHDGGVAVDGAVTESREVLPPPPPRHADHVPGTKKDERFYVFEAEALKLVHDWSAPSLIKLPFLFPFFLLDGPSIPATQIQVFCFFLSFFLSFFLVAHQVWFSHMGFSLRIWAISPAWSSAAGTLSTSMEESAMFSARSNRRKREAGARGGWQTYVARNAG
jgi:hypothetical protein